MSLLIDSRICPDCRAGLDPAATCTRCGLHLAGPLAVELWAAMKHADSLIEQLRATPLGPSAAPGPSTERPRRARGLQAGSVPTVLFSVGALCLVVAGVVFVAVAWSSLGLGTRATILLGVTGLIAGVAATLTRRGLRGAAETFWTLVAAFVVLDLIAAHSSGLAGFDALSSRSAGSVIGSTLIGLGIALEAWVRRTATGSLVVAPVLTGLGAALVAATQGWSAPQAAAGTAAVTGALIVAVAASRRTRLTGAAISLSTVAGLSWLVLLGIGVGRIVDAVLRSDPRPSWWLSTAGWPLLAAAGLAALVVLVSEVALATGRRSEALHWRQVGAATAAELALAFWIIGPAGNADLEILLLAGVTTGFAAASLSLPRVWALPAAGFAALGTTSCLGYLLLRPFVVLNELPTTAPLRSANLDLVLAGPPGPAAGWTALVLAAAVVLGSRALIGQYSARLWHYRAVQTWSVLTPCVLALGLVVALLENAPTLLPAVAAAAGLLALLGLLARLVPDGFAGPVLAAAGYLCVLGLRLAVPSHLLAALLASGIATGLALAYRRTSAADSTRALTGIAALAAAGFALLHWPFLGGSSTSTACILVAALAAAVALTAPVLARHGDRVVAELAACALGAWAIALTVDAGTASIVLTLLGSAAAGVAVIHADRRPVAWLGTIVLGAGALIRFADGLAIPELVTAPAAALLLLAGIHRLRTDAAASSRAALGSGLTLALLPSLLLALDEPVSLRALGVGILAVAILALGIGQRWSAAFLAGAAVLAVLAVRHLGPYAEGLPRWLSLGTVGVALLAVAITWESRWRQLVVAERYLAALR